MKVRIFEGMSQYLQNLADVPTRDISASVRQILETVKQTGDAALAGYTRQFDKIALTQFKVPPDALKQALSALPPSLKETICRAATNIKEFHQRQKTETQLRFEKDGAILGWKVSPIDCVGIYVPGGRAVYPSTVLMNVIPAQVAGVPRIVVVSPPTESGLPHTLILATLELLGITEIYAVGGAQAIGALAYGTETIEPVYKITGPGNAWVAEAKRQVYGIVGIDSFAGPSEIMIACTQPEIPVEYLGRDMLSQAEHDPDARAVLVTNSSQQALSVAAWLEEIIPTLPRREIIEASFLNNSAIVVEEHVDDIFDAINVFAPEHLELLIPDPFEKLHKIRNAGAVFMGPYSPEPVGDYFAGPNHTLPTSGCAKFSSPLGVQDFIKTTSVIGYSAQRLRQDSTAIMEFAESEGLYAHASAVRARLEIPLKDRE
ncbi:MAG: histidinol dehydrogenase [SAR324 cluster bacterium]|nr:histidinol dehydrogenase [SAR324 cluster bacterium]